MNRRAAFWLFAIARLCYCLNVPLAAEYPHVDLTRQIIGAFFDVYYHLGAGFREVVYQRTLVIATG
ncbi:MAG: hypothetical protein HY700_17135 [Gemmatimonadetes bacterium]|nr:hypothetical protein [Gemmatimonadota bacterium]